MNGSSDETTESDTSDVRERMHQLEREVKGRDTEIRDLNDRVTVKFLFISCVGEVDMLFLRRIASWFAAYEFNIRERNAHTENGIRSNETRQASGDRIDR